MAVTTSLDTTELTVHPGEQVECPVRIRNTGSVVDRYTVDVVGDARQWAVVEPATINLMPGDTATAVVWFRPPRSSAAPAGRIPFGLRVTSIEEPDGRVVEEGVVVVAPFTELTAELVPTTSRCRRRARHDVLVENAGNHPLEVDVTATEPDGRLRLRLDRSHLVLDPGTIGRVRLTATPLDRFLRGPEQRHPFVVTVSAPAGDPITVNGVVEQRQLLSRWLLPVLAGLLALLLLFGVLWFTVLRPVLRSTATEAEAERGGQAGQGAPPAPGDEPGAAAPGAPAGPEGSGGGGAEPDAGTAQEGAAAGEPTTFDIVTNAPVTPDLSTFTNFPRNRPVPDGAALVLTDVTLRNPNGDGGVLRVLRGREILLEVGLNNFRELDIPLEEPWRFVAGQQVILAVSCQSATTGSCTPSATFAGRLVEQ